MIVFMDNPNLINVVRSYYPTLMINVFNLSSLYSGFTDVTELITRVSPINSTGMIMPVFVESPDFDIRYASGILNDPLLFSKFMMFVKPSYEGSISIIMVQRDPYRDAVMESLIKLIQQRYGYNCWVIEDADDISFIKEGDYSPYGLLALKDDVSKFNTLIGVDNNGGM